MDDRDLAAEVIVVTHAMMEKVRELHRPTLQVVEWFHDQTGKGEALCCPSCRPANPTEWHPEVGQAGIEPEGFVHSYVVSPCPTLAALDSVEAVSARSRDEWLLWLIEDDTGKYKPPREYENKTRAEMDIEMAAAVELGFSVHQLAHRIVVRFSHGGTYTTKWRKV